MERLRSIIIPVMLALCTLLCACAKSAEPAVQVDLPEKTEAPLVSAATEQAAEHKGGVCVLLKEASSAASLRMAMGAQEYAAFSGMDIFVRGIESAEDAEFASLVKQTLSQAPDALCIVFEGGAQTDAALEEARSAGVKVVVCGSAGLKNADAAILPSENAILGAALMDSLAESMGEKGEYAILASSEQDKTENEMALGAIEHQRQVYPDMKLSTGETPVYCGEGSDAAYEAATEMMKGENAPQGMLLTSQAGTQGAARAVNELELKDKLFVCGVGAAEQDAGLLQNGFVNAIIGSDPSLDIQAACSLTRMLLEGNTLEEHGDLGVIGYNDISRVQAEANTFAGNSITAATAETIAAY